MKNLNLLFVTLLIFSSVIFSGCSLNGDVDDIIPKTSSSFIVGEWNCYNSSNVGGVIKYNHYAFVKYTDDLKYSYDFGNNNLDVGTYSINFGDKTLNYVFGNSKSKYYYTNDKNIIYLDKGGYGTEIFYLCKGNIYDFIN